MRSPTPRALRLFLTGLCLALETGCYPVHWKRGEIKPMPLGRLQQLKIWSGDTVFRWHAVIITYDSITGVPYKMSTKCDSCRLGLRLSSVDSIRVGYPSSPAKNILMLAFLVAAFTAPFH